MFFKKSCLFAVSMLGLLTVPALAQNGNSGAQFMPRGVPADAPSGFVQMCQRDGAICRAEASDSALAAKTDAAAWTAQDEAVRLKLLETINARVNSDIRFQPDRQELWQRPVAEAGKKMRGDCEDYALEKRARLVSAGFPADRLSFAVAYVPRAGLHTVLIARLDGGEFVLDNRSPWVKDWREINYVWLLRQSETAPMEWRNLLYQPATQIAGL